MNEQALEALSGRIAVAFVEAYEQLEPAEYDRLLEWAVRNLAEVWARNVIGEPLALSEWGRKRRARMSGHHIAAELRRYTGQRLLGVVECPGCVEFVFSEAPDGPNLLSIDSRGRYSHGSVSDPEDYAHEAEAWRQSEAA